MYIPCTLVIPTLVALTAGLAFGFSSACSLQIYFTVGWAAFFASSLNIGGLVGGFISSPMLSYFGRKFTLLLSCVPSAFGWFGIYICSETVYKTSFPTYRFMLGRLLTGLGAGISIPSAATYLVEMASQGQRGLVGSLPQVGIVTGIAVSFLCAVFLTWDIIAFINAIIVSVLCLLTCLLPESTQWLQRSTLTKGDNAMAVEMVDYGSPDCSQYCKSWKAYAWPCLLVPERFQPRLRLALFMMVLQQLTGINAILYFAESVCLIGDAASPPLCAFFIGLFQMIFTIIAAFIINQASRKRMLEVSAIIMTLAHVAYGITVFLNSSHLYLSQFWIILYILGFSIGWGPLPILITTELFPISSRGAAVSAAVSVNWLFGFIVTGLFEILNHVMHPSILFVTFALFCVISAVYVRRYLPETSHDITCESSANFRA